MKRTFTLPFGVPPVVPARLQVLVDTGVLKLGPVEKDGLVRWILVETDSIESSVTAVVVGTMFQGSGTSVIVNVHVRDETTPRYGAWRLADDGL